MFTDMQSKSISFAQPNGLPMELRKELRYRLEAPAFFSWDSSDRKRLQGEGVTRDISVFGVFILTPTCPPVDAPVQVEVILPSLNGPKPVIRVCGVARVLRVEHSSRGQGENGFAVVSEDFSRWNMSTVEDDVTFAHAQDIEVAGGKLH
jgi:hypothetical protein